VVLDRQLPSNCRSCNGHNWKQVSLRKVQRAAPMERDLLLPRGEELPFLNSIHIPDLQSKAPLKQGREAQDDYEGL
ncbi:mcm10, partial [Symbiodinium pilosum]